MYSFQCIGKEDFASMYILEEKDDIAAKHVKHWLVPSLGRAFPQGLRRQFIFRRDGRWRQIGLEINRYIHISNYSN